MGKIRTRRCLFRYKGRMKREKGRKEGQKKEIFKYKKILIFKVILLHTHTPHYIHILSDLITIKLMTFVTKEYGFPLIKIFKMVKFILTFPIKTVIFPFQCKVI